MQKLYKITKNNGYWIVATIDGNVTQFRSASKANCREWLSANNLLEQME